jgi:hypothetical protein
VSPRFQVHSLKTETPRPGQPDTGSNSGKMHQIAPQPVSRPALTVRRKNAERLAMRWSFLPTPSHVIVHAYDRARLV